VTRGLPHGNQGMAGAVDGMLWLVLAHGRNGWHAVAVDGMQWLLLDSADGLSAVDGMDVWAGF